MKGASTVLRKVSQNEQFTQRDVLSVARNRGYLAINEGSGHLTFSYKAEQRRSQSPAIVLHLGERTAELSAVLNNGAMTDSLKIDIAARFAALVLPFGSVIVTNRHIVCTRLSYAVGYDAAEWLAEELNGTALILEGEMDSRKHARIEFKKRGDGSLKVLAGAAYLRGRREEGA